MKNIIKIGGFVVAVILLGFLLHKGCKPKLSGELREKFENQNPSDSTMIESRQIGNISLDKFITLALQAKFDFDTTCVKRDGDSILIIVKRPKMFYGKDEGEWWRERYKKLPIRILNDNSFKARINVINDKEYIYIPYHILSCLVVSIGESNASKSTPKEIQKDGTENDVTFQEKDLAKIEENGTKIQTGGWVFKNVSDVITKSGDHSGNKEKQLEILWRYARNHWIYINDPAVGIDTWRSASETIETYYFTSEKQYTGDCDDFAILMASFARQVGLDSRFVCAVGKGGGHAYAEFRRESDGQWIPMDWFSDCLGGKPFDGKRVVYENL
ncbi:hypothetical protein AGMMS49965_25490 [Bacteroidia bacterium]|nr:hypothetical protein AGMMS49965_25490 [Bacteroidia bacterium]